MTEITHEALEALDKKATQGVWYYFPGSERDQRLAVALVNLFRTGQLILAQPSGIPDEWGDWVETDCPSCHGQNISCPDGCGRDPETGELNGTRLQPSGDEVEAVAASLDPDAMDPATPCAFREQRQVTARKQATAAITTLDAVRGKQ